MVLQIAEKSSIYNMPIELKSNLHQEKNLTLLEKSILEFLRFVIFEIVRVLGSNIRGCKLYQSLVAIFRRYLLLCPFGFENYKHSLNNGLRKSNFGK